MQSENEDNGQTIQTIDSVPDFGDSLPNGDREGFKAAKNESLYEALFSRRMRIYTVHTFRKDRVKKDQLLLIAHVPGKPYLKYGLYAPWDGFVDLVAVAPTEYVEADRTCVVLSRY